MESIKKYLLLIIFLNTLGISVMAQENKVYDDMTLDELLDIDVVITASKHPEDLFETPLSTTIISKKEIERSGVTSIPEALRLSQGVIVREVTPGNYDIHIRGYDDITKNVYLALPYNTTTLVMIDNRVVYSYFSGGTLWETFPIDLNDVERIEVVRGPAAALYGPNAVTGVINIITSHANKKGKNILVNSTIGTNKAKNVNATIGYNWNNKTKLSFSGNFTERYRFNEDYYDFNKNDYCSLDDVTMIVSAVNYENPDKNWTFNDFRDKLGADYDVDLSLRKMGGNIFFAHNFSEHSNIDIAVGAQKSQSQRNGFFNFATALSQIESNSFYLNSKFKHQNIYTQLTINSGENINNYKYNSVKFTKIEGNLEYFKQFKTLSIRPGISYKHLSYNSPITYNEPFSLSSLNYQFKDEPRVTSAYSAFMLSEWKPTSKLRIIGAVRVDKFDINKHYFTSYEIASTYRLNKNNLLRVAHSKANKSPFFFDSFVSSSALVNINYPSEDNTSSFPIPINFSINGNANLKYPTITNQEIGWRTKINSNLGLDVELFYSNVNNFVNPNVYRTFKVSQLLNAQGMPETIVGIDVEGNVKFENYDLTANQFGAGFTLNYNFSEIWMVKIYGTYQKTNISGRKDIDVQTTDSNVAVDPNTGIVTFEESTIMNPTQWSDELTPSFFGGFLLNYNPNEKWNFSTDAYLISDQVFSNSNYYKLVDENSIDAALVEMNIKSNIILNTKASFQINKNTSTNLTIKNIFGKQREFGFSDQIGRQLLIGLKWEF